MKRVVPTPFPIDPLVADAGVLGAAIRSARTGAGMTIDQAAAALGISKQTLSDLETSGSTVGLGIALKVARELGVSVFVTKPGERETIRRVIAGQPITIQGHVPLVLAHPLPNDGTPGEGQLHQVIPSRGHDDHDRKRKRRSRK